MRIVDLGRQGERSALPSSEGSETTWIHVDLENDADVGWLKADSGLDEEAVDSILERQQPVVRHKLRQGHYVHGFYTRLGREPSQDLVVDIGFWIEPRRVITLNRSRRDTLINELTTAVHENRGPATPWELFAWVVSRVPDDVERNLAVLVASVDVLEDKMLEEPESLPIDDLASLRRRLSYVRRYEVPLTSLLGTVAADVCPGMDADSRAVLRTAVEALAQSNQILQFAAERTSVIQEQIQNQLSERMSRATYRLTLVATVFLPLGFLTGLLGINVAGVPGTHDPYAFWLVCAALLVVAVVSTWAVARSTRR